MAEEEELSFGKLAIERGYCNKQQLDDALYTLQEVNKLGLNEKLGNILVKKKYMTEAQIKEILKLQGQKSKIKIAGYEIIEKVGQGGMGAVFKARQVSLDRIVALKILAPKLAADKSFCERFIKEARAVAKLSHPNIIVGIDVGQHDKYFYFAMEYVEGETALRMLRDSGPFAEEKALQIALQISHALDHAHKHNLVHRDIKPDNIMVTPRGEAKLCDLGLAKVNEGDAGQTRSSVAVGTPHYIAPEQARGESGVGITADIYALGATLYHMTTGATLFQGDSSRDIMAQHLTDEAPNARKKRPDLSESFCRMLERMLAKSPKDRYLTPNELSEDIERVLDKKALKTLLPAAAKTSMERTQKTGRKDATTGPRAPIDRVTTGPRSPIDRPEPSTGPKAAVGSGKPMVILAAVVVLALGVGVGVAVSGGGNHPPAVAKETKAPVKPPVTSEAPLPTVVLAKKDDVPPPENPQPAKVDTGPQEKSGYEPLDKARQARREKPTDFANLIAMFDAAEKGAPADILPKIRSEKSDVERAMAQTFQVYLNNRTREADRKMSQKNYGPALGMFVEADFPAAVMSEGAKADLAKKRAEFESRVADIFEKTDKQELTRDLQAAGNDPNKLAALREKIKNLHPSYNGFKPAQDFLNATDQRADQVQKLIAGASDKANDVAFHNVMDLASHAAKNDDLAGALRKIEEGYSNQAMIGKFGAQMEVFKTDLIAVQEVVKKAGEVLEAKIGTPEAIEVYINGTKVAGVVTGKGGNEKTGPAVIVKDSAGQSQPVPFAKLDTSDLLRLVQVKPDAPQGRYLTGIVRFWMGSYGKSFETLKPLKGQKPLGERAEFYFAAMEYRAGQLLDMIHNLGREIHDAKFPPDKEPEKRKDLLRMVERLNREYSLTEVYHARTGR